MDEAKINALTAEIDVYAQAGKFQECIEKINEYLDIEGDPIVRALLYLNKATCALELGDTSSAREALSLIETKSITRDVCIYIDKVRINIALKEGNMILAQDLVTQLLAKPELQLKEHAELRYEMLGHMGCGLADRGRFKEALTYLYESDLGMPTGRLRDGFGLYQAYCLERMKEFSKAEKCLKRIIECGSDERVVDALFNLGNLYWARRQYDEAIESLKRAESNLPNGLKTQREILTALSGVYGDAGQYELAEKVRQQAEAPFHAFNDLTSDSANTIQAEINWYPGVQQLCLAKMPSN